MKTTPLIFSVKRDKDLRDGFLDLYNQIVNIDFFSRPLSIVLPLKAWLSANGLNTMLTFIEALFAKNSMYEISIFLFDSSFVTDVLNNKAEIVNNVDKIDQLCRKIVYYDSIDLLKNLSVSNAFVQPSFATFTRLQEHLKAFKQARTYTKYSSRMLSLSPLIDNEEEQHALTTRMETLTTILKMNLYGKISSETAQEASHHIMYELVKNIYQHSANMTTSGNIARGFACAQINTFPIIDYDGLPLVLLVATLDQMGKRTVEKSIRFLSITINDYGIGLHTQIRNSLQKKLSENGPFKIGQYEINNETLKDDSILIEVALCTDFSTKEVRQQLDNTWRTKTTNIPLQSRGYGLIYCMAFIARQLGRIQVRSGSKLVAIFSKPQAALNADIWMRDMPAIADEINSSFHKYFIKKIINIPAPKDTFPGTQILIEIPVESTLYSDSSAEE